MSARTHSSSSTTRCVSDRGDQDLTSENCLYLAERGHRCDFHSFRDVASGDKRGRVDTAGAFGIGFIAVYQVADRAVLISSGRRWDIDEMQPEANRIIENPAPDAAGTTFILPWARDPDSLFRQRTASAAHRARRSADSFSTSSSRPCRPPCSSCSTSAMWSCSNTVRTAVSLPARGRRRHLRDNRRGPGTPVAHAAR